MCASVADVLDARQQVHACVHVAEYIRMYSSDQRQGNAYVPVLVRRLAQSTAAACPICLSCSVFPAVVLHFLDCDAVWE